MDDTETEDELPTEVVVLMNSQTCSEPESDIKIEEIDETKEHFDPFDRHNTVYDNVKIDDTSVACEEIPLNPEPTIYTEKNNGERETEEDPDKKPLATKDLNCVNETEIGQCCATPLLEFATADVHPDLFDIPSTSVSENDEFSFKAFNTDDNRKFLTEEEKEESKLELEGEPLVQKKQMHCSSIIHSGPREGEVCGKKTSKNGLCKMHNRV